MKSVAGTLAAPFPYFGGKSLACETVWASLGDPENYVELAHGWGLRTWEARKGYASTDEAVENSASETLWCSPHCVPERAVQDALF